MTNSNFIRTFNIISLTVLLFTSQLKAQDTLKANATNKVNWLINLSRLKNIEDVVDSIQAKGYLITAKDESATNGMALTVICRIKLNMEYCGFVSLDGEEVTACFYKTYDKEMYNQIFAVVHKLNFKPNSIYAATPGETAYSKDNVLLILKIDSSKNKITYTLAASRLVM